MTTNYCVTRQIQWPDGDKCVEISIGDEDYVNPDSIVGHWGCHALAIEAVEDAINVATKWQEDSEEPVWIGKGHTMGCTMPFDLEPLNEETFASLREWAKKRDDELPKCDYCGTPIVDEHWTHSFASDSRFCSEYCADKDYSESCEEYESEEADDDE